MFRPEKLFKINALGLQKDKEWFISTIHQFGSLHIEDLSEKIKSGKEYSNLLTDTPLNEIEKISKLLLNANFLKEIFDKNISQKDKKDFKIENTEENFTLKSVIKTVENSLSEFEDDLLAMDNDLKNAKKEIKQKKLDIDILEKYDIDFDIGQINKSKYTKLVFGKVLKEDFDNFEFPKSIQDNSIIIKKELSKQTYSLIALYNNSIEEDFLSTFKKLNFENEKVSFSMDKISKNSIELIKSELVNLEKKKRVNNRLLKKEYNKTYPKVIYLQKLLNNAKQRGEISTNFGKTEKSFYIEAYVSKKHFNKLNEMLENKRIILHRSEPINAPIILNNFPYIQSFEHITTMFGYPSYNAIDPTFFIALFFPFFFGFMLSDVGYGLITMLMALSFLLFKKKNEVFKDLTIIFGTSAIWTIIFGILFGSFFGELINLTPLWIDPFQDSILILGVSIALGFIHLNIGLLISVYSNIINKRFKNILFDNVSIFILEASILMFVLQQNILGFALLAITTIMLLIKSSLFGLMEITGFVGLVLSYARILALSLATGGIALAINIMSKKIMDLGIIGVILSPLLIVGGHLFNFVLNIIGSSINAARLHFVEFFSLFFEEGGEKFIPFKIKK